MTTPGFAVFANELLARCFPEERRVLLVQVGVVGVPYVAIFVEVLLPATVRDLIPE